MWVKLAVFSWTPGLLERIADRRIVITQVWVFGRQLLENKYSEPIFSRHQLTALVTNHEIWTFEWKFNDWKIGIHCLGLENFPIHKDYSGEISADINKCAVLSIVWWNMSILVGLYGSVRQITNIWYCDVWVKDPCKVQGRGILCFIVLCFIALHRCVFFFKLKSNPLPAKRWWLALCQYSLYCSGMEPNPQSLRACQYINGFWWNTVQSLIWFQISHCN